MDARTIVIVKVALVIAAVTLAIAYLYYLNRDDPRRIARIEFGAGVAIFIACSVGPVLLASRDGSSIFARYPIGRFGISS